MERRAGMMRTPIRVALVSAALATTAFFSLAAPAQAATSTTAVTSATSASSATSVVPERAEFTGFGTGATEADAIFAARSDGLQQAGDAGFSLCREVSHLARFLPTRQIWAATATFVCIR